MTEQEIRKVLRGNPDSAVSTEEAFEAAEIIAKIADDKSIEWAIAGGLAIQIYGYFRQTKDVDFIAEKSLSLKIIRYLSFGGESYQISVGKKEVTVDWILRRDDYKRYYQAALTEADVLPNGWKIVSPEWLTVLKYIAGRPKDILDLQWLLQQKSLVNRTKLQDNLRRLLGREGAIGFLLGLQRFYDLADMNTKIDGDENETYVVEEYPQYNK